MNWNQVEGFWTQLRGKVREQWGKLAHRDLDVAAGKRDQVVGLLQRRYGTAQAHGESPIHIFETTSEA
jgi:uncharacterized protein YjbJ (UPF0337 family)